MEQIANHSVEKSSDLTALAGKFLTFLLDKEEYGIEIMKVQEIVGMMPVTKIPKVPDYVRGVVNLRGRIIPSIELRKKFNLDSTEDTERTCIIVVEILSAGEKKDVGIIVDELAEVLDIQGSDINPPPNFGTNLNEEVILGIGIVGDNVKILLDIDKILTKGELNSIQSITQTDPSS